MHVLYLLKEVVHMKSQASLIREITLDILKNSDDLTFISNNIYGIKYSDLRTRLLKNKQYSFTEGAVASALNTIPERVANIYKIKNKKGTFFYYSKKKIEEEKKSDTIIDSNEFEIMHESAKQTEKYIQKIIYDAGHDKYIDFTDTDSQYLREILAASYNLTNLLRTYTNQKSFDKIDTRNDLPF